MADEMKRITNKSRLQIPKGERPRFIRPVERQRMRPWLIEHLDRNDIPGLVWQNRREKVFRISWKHAANQCFNMQKDTNLFERWAIHTGRHYDSDHKRWKANFRCALNSLPDVIENKEQGIKKGNNAFKVYRFLDEKETKAVKDYKFRRRRETPEFIYKSEVYDEEEEEEEEDEEGTLMDHSYAEYQGGELVGSLPRLDQLYSQTSGVDLLLQADSKDRFKPLFDTAETSNIHEILAAASASLAAGNAAISLEQVSMEQLSHLGDISRMRLQVKGNTEKKDVCGFRFVFLCGWCEKVFPSKVELFQHFLILHQDKLLAREVYKPVVMEQGESTNQRLQKEIADLEKEVLSGINKAQTTEGGEVIEDGQVVDMSASNEMTSREMYTDVALDLTIRSQQPKPVVKEETALDLTMPTAKKQQKLLKQTGGKSALKRKKAGSLEIDYTVKFGNYGIAGKPRTKRQMSLHSRKKEEEEERIQKMNAEKQHSMEDLVHAQILMSLKTSAAEEADVDSDESAVKGEKEKKAKAKKGGKKVKNASAAEMVNLDKIIDDVAKAKEEEEETGDEDQEDSDDQEPDKAAVSEKVTEVETKGNSESKLKAYKCGLCLKKFDDPQVLNIHVDSHKPPYLCLKCTKLFDSKHEFMMHSRSHIPTYTRSMYDCGICKLGFSSEFCIQIHLNVHANMRLKRLDKPGGGVVYVKDVPGDVERTMKEIQREMAEASVERREGSRSLDHKYSTQSGEMIEEEVKVKIEEQDTEDSQGTGGGGNDEAVVDGENEELETGEHDEGSQMETDKIGDDEKGDGGKKVLETEPETGDESIVPESTESNDEVKKVVVQSESTVGEQMKAEVEEIKSSSENEVSKQDTEVKETEKTTVEDVGERKNDKEAEAADAGDDVDGSVTAKTPKLDILGAIDEGGSNLPDFSKIRQKPGEDTDQKKSSPAVKVTSGSAGSGKQRNLFSCGICNKKLKLEDIEEHLDAHEKETDKEKNHICMICKNSVADKDLNSHMQSHFKRKTVKEEVKMYVCNLCNLAFSSCHHLTDHVGKHLQPRIDQNAEIKKKLKRKLEEATENDANLSSSKKKVELTSGDVSVSMETASSANLPIVITDTELKRNSILAAALNSAPKYAVNYAAKSQADNPEMVAVTSFAKSASLMSTISGKGEKQVKPNTLTTYIKSSESVKEGVTACGEEGTKIPSKDLLNLPLLILNTANERQEVMEPLVLLGSSEDQERKLVQTLNMSQELKSAFGTGSQCLKVVMPTSAAIKTTPGSSGSSSGSLTTTTKRVKVRSGDSSPAVGTTIRMSPFTDKAAEQTNIKPAAVKLRAKIVPGCKDIPSFASKPESVGKTTAKVEKVKFVSPEMLGQMSITASGQVSSTVTSPIVSSPAALVNVTQSVSTTVSAVATTVVTPSVSQGQTTEGEASVTSPTSGQIGVNMLSATSQSQLGQNAAQVILLNHLAQTAASNQMDQASTLSLTPSQLQQLRLLSNSSTQQPQQAGNQQQVVLVKSGDLRQPLTKGVSLQLAKTGGDTSHSQQQPTVVSGVSQSTSSLFPFLIQSSSVQKSSSEQQTSSVNQPTSQPLLTVLNSQIENAITPGSKTVPSLSSASVSVQPAAAGVSTKTSPLLQQNMVNVMLTRLIQPQQLSAPATVTAAPVLTSGQKPTFNLVFAPTTSTSVPPSPTVLASTTLLSSAGSGLPVMSPSQAGAATQSVCLKLVCNSCNQKLDSLELMGNHVCDKKSSASSTPSSSVSGSSLSVSMATGSGVVSEVGSTGEAIEVRNLFPCGKCKRTYSTFQLYSSHSCSDEGESTAGVTGLHSCPLCHLILPRESDLLGHIEASHPGQLYSCKMCKDVFNSKTDMEFHVIFEHPLECNICKYRCKNDTDMRTHILNHPDFTKSKNINLQCEKCLVGFVSLKAFLNHIRFLHPEDPFTSRIKEKSSETFLMHKCTVCACAFRSKQLLFTHIEKEHYKHVVYHCGACPGLAIGYKSSQQLSAHLDNHNIGKGISGSPAPLFCHHCLLVFPDTVTHSEHSLTCTSNTAAGVWNTDPDKGKIKVKKSSPKSKPSQKSTTATAKGRSENSGSKAVATARQGKTESSSNTGGECDRKVDPRAETAANINCGQCHMMFKTFYQLKQHKVMRHMIPRNRTSTSYYQHVVDNLKRPKLFDCTICGKTFDLQAALRWHMRVHSKAKRFACKKEGCMLKFKTKQALQLHQIKCKGPGESIAAGVGATSDAAKIRERIGADVREEEESCEDLSEPQLAFDDQGEVMKEFHCKLCGHNCLSVRALKRHLQDKHVDVFVKCVDCGGIFLDNNDLSKHRTECAITGVLKRPFKKAVGPKKKFYGCAVCHKSFFKVMKLTKHMWSHDQSNTGRKIKGVKRPGAVGSGRLASTVSKNFMCCVCKETFSQSAALFQHTKSHLDTKDLVTIAKNKLKHAQNVTGDPTKVEVDLTSRDGPSRGESESERLCNVYVCGGCSKIVPYEKDRLCEAVVNHCCVN